MNIIRSFAPGFLQVSVDEAFLDLSNMENIYGLPGKAAKLLKKKIREETNLSVSIGVASSRFLAKLASDYHKPDGLTIVPPERNEEFIDKVGLRKLWGIGEKTYERLLKKGISSTKILREIPYERLKTMFGNSLAGKDGANNMMKFYMMSQMMNGNGGNNNLMPFMFMMNGGGNMFDNMFGDMFGTTENETEEN